MSMMVAASAPSLSLDALRVVQCTTTCVPNRCAWWTHVQRHTAVPIGVLVTPLVHMPSSLPSPWHEAQRQQQDVTARLRPTCTRCGATYSRFSATASHGARSAPEWRCVVCAHGHPVDGSNNDDLEHNNDSSHRRLPSFLPSPHVEIIDEVLPIARSVPPSPHFSRHVVFVLDTACSMSTLHTLREHVKGTLDALPRDALVSLLTFDHIVRLHALPIRVTDSCSPTVPPSSMSSSICFSGRQSLASFQSSTSYHRVFGLPQRHQGDSTSADSRSFDPLHWAQPASSCADAIMHTLDTLCTADRHRRSAHERSAAEWDSASLSSARCTGLGLYAAVELVAMIQRLPSRALSSPTTAAQIFCLTHGHPSIGPGAVDVSAGADTVVASVSTTRAATVASVENAQEHALNAAATEFYAALALRATAPLYSSSTTTTTDAADASPLSPPCSCQINIMCTGAEQFHAPILRAATWPTGGQLLLYPTVEDARIPLDIAHLVHHLAALHTDLTVRCSPNLHVSRALGPVRARSAESPLERVFSATLPSSSSSGRIESIATHEVVTLRLPAMTARTASLAFLIDAIDDIPSDHVHVQLQCVVVAPPPTFDTSADRSPILPRLVRRTITIRLRTTGSWNTFLNSVDVPSCCILAVKLLVADGMRRVESAVRVGCIERDDVARAAVLSYKSVKAVVASSGDTEGDGNSNPNSSSNSWLPSSVSGFTHSVWSFAHRTLVGETADELAARGKGNEDDPEWRGGSFSGWSGGDNRLSAKASHGPNSRAVAARLWFGRPPSQTAPTDEVDTPSDVNELVRADLVAELDRRVRGVHELCALLAAKRLMKVGATDVDVLPQHLSPLLTVMHAVRRGPLLGPVLHTIDDVHVLRALFLASPFDECYRCMLPALTAYDVEAGRYLGDAPLDQSSLRESYIVFLDQEHVIAIWSGVHTVARGAGTTCSADHVREAWRAHAESLASLRFPRPSIVVTQQGSSTARIVQSRLPPPLASDSAEHRAIRAMCFSDEPSLEEFAAGMRQMRVS